MKFRIRRRNLKFKKKIPLFKLEIIRHVLVFELKSRLKTQFLVLNHEITFWNMTFPLETWNFVSINSRFRLSVQKFASKIKILHLKVKFHASIRGQFIINPARHIVVIQPWQFHTSLT